MGQTTAPTQSQSPRLQRSSPPPPAPSPDTRLAAPTSSSAAAESGFSASQLSPLEFNFRPMDGSDALANGFAVPGTEPSSSSGRTLGRQSGRTAATHGSATAGTTGSSGPVRGHSSLPHIGELKVFLEFFVRRK